MDSVYLRERALHGTLSPPFFLLQFVLICLFWELAQCLGSWWSRPGPSPNVFLQVRFHVAVLSPFLCQALARPLSHVPSLLTWAGSLSRDWSRCQRSSEHKDKRGGLHTRRKGLTFRGKTLRFVYRAMCFRRLMKGRRAEKKKNNAGDSEQREGRGGVLVSSVGRPHGCVCEGL